MILGRMSLVVLLFSLLLALPAELLLLILRTSPRVASRKNLAGSASMCPKPSLESSQRSQVSR